MRAGFASVSLVALVAPVDTMRVLILGGGGVRPAMIKQMYEPAWSTLLAGFEAYPRRAELSSVRFELQNASRLRNATADLKRGDLFVWLGDFRRGRPDADALRRRGVHTVHYRSEPREYCNALYLKGMLETWEFTHDNMNCKFLGAPLSRFVPPGALPAPAVSHPAHTLAPLASPISKQQKARWECLNTIKQLLPNGKVKLISNVWTEAAWVRATAITSVWFSVHKRCNNSVPQPFESFRASTLLRYGRLLLSERSHAQDERAFAGIVRFLKVEDIPREYLRLAALSQAERTALGEASRSEFASRFDPAVLFRQAGIYELLDKLLQADGPLLPASRALTQTGSAAQELSEGSSLN
jgi:hypothetical protein